MPTARCLVCANEGLRAYVNSGLDKGITNAGIAAGLVAAGGSIDPDVIGRHKKAHWAPPPPPAGTPQPTKRDLAIMVRDKVADAIEGAVPRTRVVKEDGEWIEKEVPFDILDKDIAAGLSAGLKAQTIVDKRETDAKKLGLAAGYLGLQMLLQGLGQPGEAPALDDGLTIEGDAVEVA